MEEEQKDEQIKLDAVLRIMDVIIKGLKTKEEKLTEEKERMAEKAWEERSGWDRIKWMEKLDKQQQKYRREAEARKGRKMKQMTRKKRGKNKKNNEQEEGPEAEDGKNGRKEEEEEEEEEVVTHRRC